MERYERWEYRHGKEVLLAVLVVIGLFAGYTLAQAFVVPEIAKVLYSFGVERGERIELPAVYSNQTEIEKADTDSDGLSDWFEENFSHTDPKVVNERYLLYIDGIAPAGWSYNMADNFISAYRFAPENVILIMNATFADFERGVGEIAEKANENDLVYVQISGHGDGPRRESEVIESITMETGEIATKIRMKDSWTKTEPQMQFSEDKVLTYKEVGEILNRIKPKKMLVSYSSCAANTAIPVLNETLNRDPNHPRVIMGQAVIDFGIGRSFSPENGNISIRELYPIIKDNYLSVKDYFQYDKDNYPEERVKEELAKIQESIEKGRILKPLEGDMPFIETLRIGMADPYNISGDFYFGEARVKDLYQP